MPNGLLKEFSEHEVRSLIAYLSGRVQTPLLATPDNATAYFFNRQDLGTWHPVGPEWRVEDGAVAAPAPSDGTPAVPVSDLVLPGDFHLTLRFHAGENGRGAVQLRDARKPDEAGGLRVEFTTGQPLVVSGAENVDPENQVRPDAWNKLEIVLSADRLEAPKRRRRGGTSAIPAAGPVRHRAGGAGRRRSRIAFPPSRHAGAGREKVTPRPRRAVSCNEPFFGSSGKGAAGEY